MDDPIDGIRALGAFPGFDTNILQTLDPPPEVRRIAAGETLIRQGEAGDAYYVVAQGRLRVFVTRRSGGARAVADLMPGEGVGEMSLLLEEPTSATVRAIRDGVVVRIPRPAFLQLLQRSPAAAMAAARSLAARLKKDDPEAAGPGRVRTVTLLPLHQGIDVPALAAALGAASRPLVGKLTVVDAATLCADQLEPPPDADTSLNDLEAEQRLTLYAIPPETPPGWTRLLAQRADHLLVLGAVGAEAEDVAFELAWLGFSDRLLAPRTDLVLMHGRDWMAEPATQAWLERVEVDQWHHVRESEPGDLARLGRVLSGKALTLLLGGGNAPALAQIGVLRAFADVGLPVDRIVGTSIGAVTGAHAALGYDAPTVEKVAVELWQKSPGVAGRLAPGRALRRGRRLRKLIRDSCRGRQIEDLPVPLVIVWPDEESGAHFAERGDLGALVERSLSRPGSGDALFLDEPLFMQDGLPATLPVDAAFARFGGSLIAVDVGARAAADSGSTVAPGGFGRQLLASNNRRHVDMAVTPTPPTSAPFAFHRLAAFVDAGYDAALEALRVAPGHIAHLLPGGLGALPADREDGAARRARRQPLTARRSSVWAITGGLVVIAAVLALWRALDPPLPVPPPHPSAATEAFAPLPVAWVPVEQQTRFETVDQFSGVVESRRRATLSLSTAGLVAEVLVDEGDRVAAGDVLLRLDTRELEARRDALVHELAQGEAAVARVMADLPAAEARLDRQRQLLGRGSGTRQSVDDAQSRVDVLLADLRSAEAARDSLEARLQGLNVGLETSVLRAPYPGTITSRLVDEGLAINPATPLLTLVEDAVKRVRAGLPPEVAQDLAPGRVVPVRVGGRMTSARLRTLVPALDAATRTIPAVFEIDDPERRLPDGALARLSIERTVRAPGAWLPETALLGGARGLWTVYALVPAAEEGDETARVERRAVQVRHSQRGRVYVDGALAEGERVVAVGVDRIVPGQRVAPRPLAASEEDVATAGGDGR